MVKIQLSDHFTYSKLLRFVYPSIVMMVFTSVYSVVDGYFVSNFVGKTPFAALNLIFPVAGVFGAVGFMVGTGGSAIVARTLGEGRPEDANRYFSMMVEATVASGVVLTLLALWLMRPIAALATALRPELTIVDSLCGDLDFEEGGNPVPTGRMLLGEDPVQLDAYGCRLMGLALEQAPYIQMAEAWGAGSTRLEEGDVVRLNEPSAVADYPAPSGAVAALTRTVQARSACSACYASLVRALHTSGVQGLPIAIGQGWRGIPFDGLGVGACCNCAKERVPGCPPPAEDILRVLSARC